MFLNKEIFENYLRNEKDILKEDTGLTVPRNSTQNLKSKMDSLLRSIEQLTAKKMRIEFEIKRQKRALANKREELKRVSKSSQAKVKLALESSNEFSLQEEVLKEQQETQRLLRESARTLEE